VSWPTPLLPTITPRWLMSVASLWFCGPPSARPSL
jgi:hypothetical protein